MRLPGNGSSEMIDLSSAQPSRRVVMPLEMSAEGAAALRCIGMERGLGAGEVVERWVTKWVLLREKTLGGEVGGAGGCAGGVGGGDDGNGGAR